MSHRILLAEDSQASAVLMVAALESLGCAVRVAADGLQAQDAAKTEVFDVILMDVNMPKCDGLEATRQIRAAGPNTHTPILGLTGEDDGAVRRAAQDVGMTGYLVKPVDKATLMRIIERTLRDVRRRA